MADMVVENGVERELTEAEKAELGSITSVSLEVRRVQAKARVDTVKAVIIAAGYAVRVDGEEVHVQCDSIGSDLLEGMRVTAVAAQAGATAWPANYQSWVALEAGKAVPLPTPQRGITLATSVANWLSAMQLYASVLKSVVAVSDDPESVDIESGWPEAQFNADAAQAFENWRSMLDRRMQAEEAV